MDFSQYYSFSFGDEESPKKPKKVQFSEVLNQVKDNETLLEFKTELEILINDI